MAEENQCPVQMPVKRVYAAISAVQTDLSRSGIAKGKKNTQQNFMFRGIDDVHNALAPIFAKHKLLMLPRIISREMMERGVTSSGNKMYGVVVNMEYDLISAEDGSIHIVRVVGEAMDSGDKATNKALSVAYKYAAIQTFCIPLAGLDDADAHSPKAQETIKQALDRMVPAFAELGVTKGKLEIKLGHPLGQCTKKEINELRGIYKTIADGTKTWIDYINPQGANEKRKQLTMDDVQPAADGADF
jgi:hypothetical protein